MFVVRLFGSMLEINDVVLFFIVVLYREHFMLNTIGIT